MKEAVALMTPAAVQTAQQKRRAQENINREKLNYGRLYLNGSATSLEYYRAYFGAFPEASSAPLVFADPFHACTPLRNNVTGAIVVVRRGRCTFLDKAHNVSMANASAVVIVNMNDKIFRVSGGYALGDKPINITLPSNITVAMVKASSMQVLKQAVSASSSAPLARFVPLECGDGRSVCEPVTTDDRDYITATAMDSGYITIPGTGERFEFVAATFGGVMPQGEVRLTGVRPGHACGRVPKGPLGWAQFLVTRAAWDLVRGYGWPKDGSRLEGKAVLVERGRCQLGYKALNLQGTGAKLMVVISPPGEPIEPFGATSRMKAKIQLPAIMVNNEAGRRLQRLIGGEKQEAVVILTPARPGFAPAWLDLAHITWPAGASDKMLEDEYAKHLAAHASSSERTAYVQDSFEKEVERRKQEQEGKVSGTGEL
jgi:hypothetical protein